MWADPKTCLTVRSSGLPVGRRVQVYCFAPPYADLPKPNDLTPLTCLLRRSITDANLTRLADKMVVSLVYSHDVVSRLSLGSVRDLRNAAMWLCEAEVDGKAQEGWSAVTKRAKQWTAGSGTKEDMDWVCLHNLLPFIFD